MKEPVWFVTGTGTEVGKTIFAAHWAAFLTLHHHLVSVFKPVASGPRSDARLLRIAVNNRQPLSQINPWHYREPIAPMIAARREQTRLTLRTMTEHILRTAQPDSTILIEGAGGLLSPLAEKIDSRDLIESLQATPLIVAPLQLGAVNQIRMTLEALPARSRRKAWLILMLPAKPTMVSRSTLECLAEYGCLERCVYFPRLSTPRDVAANLNHPAVRKALKPWL